MALKLVDAVRSTGLVIAQRSRYGSRVSSALSLLCAVLRTKKSAHIRGFAPARC